MIDRHPATARELASVLGRTKPGQTQSRGTMDPEVAERLRSLGYVGSGGSDAEPPATGLRDPKDGAALRDLMTTADQQLRRGDQRAAAATFDRVLSQDPRNRFALLRSGSALLQLGELRPAIARLRTLLQVDPDHVEGHEALAAALSRAGQHASAARGVEGGRPASAPPGRGVGQHGSRPRSCRQDGRRGEGVGPRRRARARRIRSCWPGSASPSTAPEGSKRPRPASSRRRPSRARTALPTPGRSA